MTWEEFKKLFSNNLHDMAQALIRPVKRKPQFGETAFKNFPENCFHFQGPSFGKDVTPYGVYKAAGGQNVFNSEWLRGILETYPLYNPFFDLPTNCLAIQAEVEGHVGALGLGFGGRGNIQGELWHGRWLYQIAESKLNIQSLLRYLKENSEHRTFLEWPKYSP